MRFRQVSFSLNHSYLKMMLDHSLINQAGIVKHHSKKLHIEYHKHASPCHLLDIYPIEKLNGINCYR